MDCQGCSTNSLVGSGPSEASDESEVDDGDGRGVSAGEMLAEEDTLLEVVEAKASFPGPAGTSLVADIV
jgi:hypothetical protein